MTESQLCERGGTRAFLGHIRSCVQHLAVSRVAECVISEALSISDKVIGVTRRIPVGIPDRLRYRFLHDHAGRALTAALRGRPDRQHRTSPLPREEGAIAWTTS
jgi:hypothetical protein